MDALKFVVVAFKTEADCRHCTDIALPYDVWGRIHTLGEGAY